MIIKKGIYYTVKGIDIYLLKQGKKWSLFYWDNLFTCKIPLYHGYFIGGYSKLKSFERPLK